MSEASAAMSPARATLKAVVDVAATLPLPWGLAIGAAAQVIEMGLDLHDAYETWAKVEARAEILARRSEDTAKAEAAFGPLPPSPTPSESPLPASYVGGSE